MKYRPEVREEWMEYPGTSPYKRFWQGTPLEKTMVFIGLGPSVFLWNVIIARAGHIYHIYRHRAGVAGACYRSIFSQLNIRREHENTRLRSSGLKTRFPGKVANFNLSRIARHDTKGSKHDTLILFWGNSGVSLGLQRRYLDLATPCFLADLITSGQLLNTYSCFYNASSSLSDYMWLYLTPPVCVQISMHNISTCIVQTCCSFYPAGAAV